MAVWHINETEDFFLTQVPLQKNISHWHKRLQHLAGRLLLKEMYPEFPVKLIRIADTKKPYLENEPYHFSISHCGDYAAAIVSKTFRVGVDVELKNERIEQIQHKFIFKHELKTLQQQCAMPVNKMLTLIWSAKESVFKWWGSGNVDFKKDIKLKTITGNTEQGTIHTVFKKEHELVIHYLFFNDNFLTWVLTDH